MTSVNEMYSRGIELLEGHRTAPWQAFSCLSGWASVEELLHLTVPNHGKLFKALLKAYLGGDAGDTWAIPTSVKRNVRSAPGRGKAIVSLASFRPSRCW